MTDKQFATVWTEALEDNSSREAFASDWATSTLFLDSEDTAEIDMDIYEQLAHIWDVAHMGTKGMRQTVGLTQAQLADRFCIAQRTIERWDSRGGCPAHTYLMLAQLLGLLKR